MAIPCLSCVPITATARPRCSLRAVALLRGTPVGHAGVGGLRLAFITTAQFVNAVHRASRRRVVVVALTSALPALCLIVVLHIVLHRAPFTARPLARGHRAMVCCAGLLVTAHGSGSGRALATGMAWAGLCLVFFNAPSLPSCDGDELNTNPPAPFQICKRPPATKPKRKSAGHQGVAGGGYTITSFIPPRRKTEEGSAPAEPGVRHGMRQECDRSAPSLS